MLCSNCQNELREAARFCDNCGTAAVQSNTESAQTDSGVSQETGAGTAESQDTAATIADTALENTIACPNCGNQLPADALFCNICGETLTATLQPQPQQMSIPEGFLLDPNTGYYYKAMPGNDPATGISGMWYTWFYPESGEYQQQFYPGG
ncbi:MAG: zinc ribbon domain-containing protein [Lachnospiraceae bacterium]|jgi:predicted amidophosphoribosyltransferase|nr:zinc ribbon domain-containing protein [Lachnospiraceae bacterium]